MVVRVMMSVGWFGSVICQINKEVDVEGASLFKIFLKVHLISHHHSCVEDVGLDFFWCSVWWHLPQMRRIEKRCSGGGIGSSSNRRIYTPTIGSSNNGCSSMNCTSIEWKGYKITKKKQYIHTTTPTRKKTQKKNKNL